MSPCPTAGDRARCTIRSRLMWGRFSSAGVIGLLSSIFIVDERQRALVLQFGQIRQAIEDPGLYFKIPIAQQVVYYDDLPQGREARRSRRLDAATRAEDARHHLRLRTLQRGRRRRDDGNKPVESDRRTLGPRQSADWSGSRSSNSGSRFSDFAAKLSIMSVGWNMPLCQTAMWRSPSAMEWSRA